MVIRAEDDAMERRPKCKESELFIVEPFLWEAIDWSLVVERFWTSDELFSCWGPRLRGIEVAGMGSSLMSPELEWRRGTK